VEVDGARKVYHVNELCKYYIRVDYAHCDNLCINVSRYKKGAVNTCAVVYEKDSDFGKIEVIEPIEYESENICNNVEQLSSQKIPPEAVAHLSKKKQKQLFHILDEYPQVFSDIPVYGDKAEHAINFNTWFCS